MNQYPSFIYTKTQPYIFPNLGLRFGFFFFLFLFLQDTGIEKPDYVLIFLQNFSRFEQQDYQYTMLSFVVRFHLRRDRISVLDDIFPCLGYRH